MSKNETTLWRYSVDFNTGGEGDFRYKKISIPCELTGDYFYGELGGRPESLRSTLSQKSCGKVFSDSDNEFHVFLEEDNEVLAKSLLAERTRERHEEIKSLYDRSHRALWFLEKEPREQKERKERADRENFERIVRFLAETSYENKNEGIKDEIHTFEEAIEIEDTIDGRGYGEAWFRAAKSHWNAIHFEHIGHYNGETFYATYYEGNQADFIVCEWNGSYEEFERLFRETAPTVYEMYRARFPEHVDTENRDSSLSLS